MAISKKRKSVMFAELYAALCLVGLFVSAKRMFEAKETTEYLVSCLVLFALGLHLFSSLRQWREEMNAPEEVKDENNSESK